MRESVIAVLALGLAFTFACRKEAETPAKDLEVKRTENLPAGEAPPEAGRAGLGAGEGVSLLEAAVEGGRGKAAERAVVVGTRLSRRSQV